jgi:ABC-2 type transport system permease protein
VFRNVFVFTLWERRRPTFWWIVGSLAYFLVLGSVYPAIRDQAADFQRLLESYPDALLAMFGLDSQTNIGTPVGFLELYASGWYLPLATIFLGIGMASRVIGGDEEAGTTDLILAGPVDRLTLVLERSAATFVAVTALGAGLLFSLWVMGPLFGATVPFEGLAGASIHATLVGWSVAALTLLAGAITGSRAISLGVATAFAVASYLINGLSEYATWLDRIRTLTPFYYATASHPLRNGVHGGHALLLLGVSIILTGLAAFFFRRRDIGT